MYLKHKPTGDVGEILDRGTLFDPARRVQTGRIHWREEPPEPAAFLKFGQVFPSDVLPACGRVDPNYPENP